MNWVDIVVVVILILSFVSGLKEGAVKSLFSVAIQLVAIFIAGLYYHLLASLLSFLPGEDWENFIGFFVTLVIITIILNLLLFIPRNIIRKLLPENPLFRLFGGALNLFNASIGLVIFTLVIKAYPVIDWLERAVADSAILSWLVMQLDFLQRLLPEIFRQSDTVIKLIDSIF